MFYKKILISLKYKKNILPQNTPCCCPSSFCLTPNYLLIVYLILKPFILINKPGSKFTLEIFKWVSMGEISWFSYLKKIIIWSIFCLLFENRLFRKNAIEIIDYATDFAQKKRLKGIYTFLENLVFKSLN